MEVTVVVIVSLLSGSCSWMMVRAPHGTYSATSADEPPNCRDGRAAPIIDTSAAVGSALSGLAGTISGLTSSPGEAGVIVYSSAIGGVLFTTLYSISASHGYSATKRCRRRRDAFLAQLKSTQKAMAAAGTHSSSDADGGDEGSSGSGDIEASKDKVDAGLTIYQAANVCGTDAKVVRDALSGNELEARMTDSGYRLSLEAVQDFCKGREPSSGAAADSGEKQSEGGNKSALDCESSDGADCEEDGDCGGEEVCDPAEKTCVPEGCADGKETEASGGSTEERGTGTSVDQNQ